ncbi:hypothetical protein ACLKA6_018556 [Drosophila palustris]
MAGQVSCSAYTIRQRIGIASCVPGTRHGLKEQQSMEWPEQSSLSHVNGEQVSRAGARPASNSCLTQCAAAAINNIIVGAINVDGLLNCLFLVSCLLSSRATLATLAVTATRNGAVAVPLSDSVCHSGTSWLLPVCLYDPIHLATLKWMQQQLHFVVLSLTLWLCDFPVQSAHSVSSSDPNTDALDMWYT